MEAWSDVSKQQAPSVSNSLIAILRGVTPDVVTSHVAALIDAGFGLIEIPTNSPDWTLSVERARATAGTRAMIGAGTVLSQAHVDALTWAGGQLAVTPNVDPSLIKAAVGNGLTVAAGFATTTEAFAAIAAGAHMLKLFPAAPLGAGSLKALKAVLPSDIPVYAGGGMTPENLGAFLGAGCHGAGLGGELFRPGQSPSVTSQKALQYIDAFNTFHAEAVA
jgi:2-dehydro-3-deoxyphosphogalactonate aldolase